MGYYCSIFSQQICCYFSKLTNVAEAYNKCLLLLMEIKLQEAILQEALKISKKKKEGKKKKKEKKEGAAWQRFCIYKPIYSWYACQESRAGLCRCQQDAPADCCAIACPNFALRF